MTTLPDEIFFDAILDFLASSPGPEAIIAYRPPEALQQRISDLLDKNRSEKLSESEQVELAEFLRLNRFMSRLKLKARQRLGA